jgi:hypothetical protein
MPLITCLFVGTAATLVSSCARVVSEPVLPPLMAPLLSAGLAYESGSAGGLRYGPVQYGYYAPPPEPYYGPPPLGDEQYYGSYGPPPGADDQYYAPYSAPLYGPPPGAR